MKRIFIVAIATIMMIGVWSCAKDAPNIGKDHARKSFDAWVAKYAPNAYLSPYKDVYIEHIERGPERGLRPVIGLTWLNINYTGKTFAQDAWSQDATGGDVFVMRDSLLARLVMNPAAFNPTTHYANDFVFYESPSAKLCEGLRQALEQMKVGDSARVYIPSDKGYSLSPMGVNPGYLSNVIYANQPIIFDIRLADVVSDPFKWERDSIKRYAQREWGTDYETDSLGFMYMHIEKPNPDGSIIGEDSTVIVYFEEYFMDGFLATTNIDTVAREWNAYNSSTDEGDPYASALISPSGGDNATLHKILNIAVPYMRKGEIADVVTVSTYAQGNKGNPSSSPEILPYQPMRYRIHVMEEKTPEEEDPK